MGYPVVVRALLLTVLAGGASLAAVPPMIAGADARTAISPSILGESTAQPAASAFDGNWTGAKFGTPEWQRTLGTPQIRVTDGAITSINALYDFSCGQRSLGGNIQQPLRPPVPLEGNTFVLTLTRRGPEDQGVLTLTVRGTFESDSVATGTYETAYEGPDLGCPFVQPGPSWNASKEP